MVAERRPEGARRLETAMRRMRTLRQSSLRRAVALRYEVSTVAESLDVFREVVGARLPAQDQRLVPLVSSMQRGQESIIEC